MRSTLFPANLRILRRLMLIAIGILILGLGIGIRGSLGVPGISVTRANGGAHHACVSQYTSNMRYVQSQAQCTEHEYPVNWGQPNFAGYEWIRGDNVEVAVGETEITRLSCPDGKNVLGGGGTASFVAESPAVDEPNMFWSFPFDEHSWQIAVHNDTNQLQEMRAYAICADVSQGVGSR